MGVPTTANYILVATLMAPVIVELGAQSGLVIPLIAVHLFVFYYGIMGDITPPVGLASFAGAAIAKENPIDVGLQGSVYAFRTVDPALHLDLQSGAAADRRARLARGDSGRRSRRRLASLTFAAATMVWFRIKAAGTKSVLLLRRDVLPVPA